MSAEGESAELLIKGRVELTSSLGQHALILYEKGVLAVDGTAAEHTFSQTELFLLEHFINNPDTPDTTQGLRTKLRDAHGKSLAVDEIRKSLGYLAHPEYVPYLGQNLVWAGPTNQRAVFLTTDSVDMTDQGPIRQTLQSFFGGYSPFSANQAVLDEFDRTRKVDFFRPSKKPLDPNANLSKVERFYLSADSQQFDQINFRTAFRELLLSVNMGGTYDLDVALSTGNEAERVIKDRIMSELIRNGEYHMDRVNGRLTFIRGRRPELGQQR